MRSDKTALQAELEQTFKWLHQHPELGHHEYQTTTYIRTFLEEHQIEILESSLSTGLIAYIPGKQASPAVALRADIDALPIQEETDIDYKSKHSGVMHACGHDFHTSALLGAALLLKDQQETLPYSVKLIFQPAEEVSNGAPSVIATGLLHDVVSIYGLHVNPALDAGVIGTKAGPLAASVDKFKITLTAQGTHAAHPETGQDVIVAASTLALAYQTVVSRNLAADVPAVVSITRFNAGTTWNVLPETAELEGTVRTYDPETRSLIQQRLFDIAKGIEITYNVQADFTWIEGSPAVINTVDETELVRKTALAHHYDVIELKASMGGEDFSHYLETIPGSFFNIGVGVGRPVHNNRFKADYSVLANASSLLSDVAKQAAEEIDNHG